MTKQDLVKEVAKKAGMTLKQTKAVLDALPKVVAEALDHDLVFIVPGVCKLKIKDVDAKPEREGRNPFTNEKITLKAKPASKKISASVVASLKRQFKA